MLPPSLAQINLSPDKPAVLREVYRVLAPGGEMYFSDIYCDRRLPQEVSVVGIAASLSLCCVCALSFIEHDTTLFN